MTKRDQTYQVLRRSAALAVFIGMLWAVQVVNWMTGHGLNSALVLIPRHASGLDGALAMPLLHGNIAHLLANMPHLFVMGGLLVATATRSSLAVNTVVGGLVGGLTWLFGSSAITNRSASGLAFGWFCLLVTRGLVDRSSVTLSASLLVAVPYGSILWGVLPSQPGVLCEGHLFGAIASVASAVHVRTRVHPPRFCSVNRD